MIDAGIIERIELIRAVRILIVGDLMLDRFVYGSVDRMSPEAPVPVLKFERETIAPGGAANLARNVQELGAHVELIGLVGRDSAYDALREIGQTALGWRLTAIESTARRTPTKTRFIANRHHFMRLDIEDASPADDKEEEEIITAVNGAVENADLVVLSDYAKGTLTPRVIAAAIAAAKRRNLPVIVDPKKRDFRHYAGANLVTPNFHEFERALGHVCENESEIVSGARQLLERAELDALLVTRGERGMTLVSRNDEPLHLPAEARQVFDVSGAGDTVVAVLAVLMASGIAVADAAYAANVGAGMVVERVGTATVGRDELITEIRRGREDVRGRKIVSLETAVRQRRHWAAEAARIVFTNGCFDLLHPGHISLLRQAKAAGQRLIVGLNSDASVRQLKGATRPIQDQESRAHVLSALEAVDLVVIFGDETPYGLIEAIKPDILVKGTDYNIDEVVGRDIVERYGGSVLLVEIVPGYSTTATIAQMANLPIT